MLKVNNVTKKFGTRVLWEDLTFCIAKGEMVALTGPSGCGKTTLLNCIGMLEPLTNGTIEFGEVFLNKLSNGKRRKLWRNKIGFLFQDYALIENLNVEKNVLIFSPHIIARPSLISSSEKALDKVGLGGRGKEPTYQFSGGEQQRVALARIIAKSPDLILADEPTGSLDPVNEHMVLEHLRGLATLDKIVVIATHSPSVISACDKVIKLGK